MILTILYIYTQYLFDYFNYHSFITILDNKIKIMSLSDLVNSYANRDNRLNYNATVKD